MKEYEVNCAVTLDIHSGHEGITHLGHIQNRWCFSVETLIFLTETCTEIFYILDLQTGERVYLNVIREPAKAPYLRGMLQGRWTDHLLQLPNCKNQCRII